MRRLQLTPQSFELGRARPNDSPWARVAFDTRVAAPVSLFGEQFSSKPRCGELDDHGACLVALPVWRQDCVERRDHEYCGSRDGETHKSQDNDTPQPPLVR